MGKNGGKKPHKDKERPSGSSESTKATTAKPTSTPAKGSHNNPKVTPQAPKGAVPSQQSGSGPKPTHSNASTNATITTNNNVPAKPITGTSGNTFHIPKGGDKRGRDPSLGSKASGLSMVPPPSKQPRTYATLTRLRVMNIAFKNTIGRNYNLEFTKTPSTTSPSPTTTSGKSGRRC